jgi:hypothetical protein
MGIHVPVPIAIFPNNRVLQHLRMYLYPMDILSLVPIVESANAPTWQQQSTCVHPMDMDILGSVPILVRANGRVLRQLRMFEHPKDSFLHVPIVIFLIDPGVL